MFTTIPDLLSPTELDAVRSVLRQSRFVDGKLSAGRHAGINKNNQELAAQQDSFDALNDVVMTRLVQHPRYLQYAMPAKISAPIYARYTEGMEYGRHIDDPIMGPPQSRYRSDISISIFLSDADEYQGGELCIESAQGPAEIKLPAGHVVLYPSTSYHSVKTITAGERLVAITWVQSHIRRADQREILVELDQVRERLSTEGHAASAQADLCYANLFRLWAEA